MAGPNTVSSASATPTQKSHNSQQSGQTASTATSQTSWDCDGLPPPAPSTNGGRNLSASAVNFAARGPSNPSSIPGSFGSDMRSQLNLSRAGTRQEMFPLEKLDEDDDSIKEQTISFLKDQLGRELKIKEGSENMLEALTSKKAKQAKDQRQRVEAELNASSQRIKDLRQKLADAQTSRPVPTTPIRSKTEGLFPGSNGMRSPPSASRSAVGSEMDEPTESPTFALAEILQGLEVTGMSPDYYVSRANDLVGLFKRHPTLKYDLVWSVFGSRMQDMLLSESREVVASGYRMIRYAISDITSLKKIRALKTDYLVTWSLIKDRKSDVEREQALKFVRAFIDVKDGVGEISRAIVRTIASVAEEADERLRPICLETLAEILVRDAKLCIASGGLGPLHEALADGSYKASDSLAAVFLYLLDSPQRRRYLRPGCNLEVLFATFTDDFSSNERTLKQNTKAISSALKTWSGLMNLCMFDFRAVRSMMQSMTVQAGPVREAVLELMHTLLRIKSPAWATSYLAGRRLTTYGRVTNLRSTSNKAGASEVEDDGGEQNFVEHFTALLLAIFIKSGAIPALLQLTQEDENPTIRRKSALLIGEVLKLSSRLLPPSWSSELQLLPKLFNAAARLKDESHFAATGVIYQISSVSRTLYRSSPASFTSFTSPALTSTNSIELALEEHPKTNASSNFDDGTFRQLLLESAVLSHSNYTKWNWDVILRLFEGPLTSGKRLEEATKASKFMKRIMSFYRPFKSKFSEIKSTRNNQKYVRVACALMHALLQSPEGNKYLADNKLLRQIAECMAQCDPTSGLTAADPRFSQERLSDTLCHGYFAMIGVLSGDARGMLMLGKWRIFNMMFRIVGLMQRTDLVRIMLVNLDYTIQGHSRVILSKALTAGSKEIRIQATNTLRKYATRPVHAHLHGLVDSRWAIQLLVTQLYDPDIEVCAIAVKILEKACNTKNHLEYIVECRPALDHLGEIGAPLLLRFLSTSIGYHYLDGLDYISNEMDDWFLGRNDAYVGVIEASLARSFLDRQEDHSNRMNVFDEEAESDADGHIPPHFYRELTRTREGCKLLSEKGHFDEFASTIRDYGMSSDDVEMMVKVKGCLWAVGNVGSMELGAPFLESCDVVEQIIRIAEEHEVMSLRGTAFFVLGLISRSVHGLEILSENGWDANTNLMGHSSGFCIPTDLSKLLSLQPWEHEPYTTIALADTQKTETIAVPTFPSRPRSESLLKVLEAGEESAQEIRNVDLDPDSNKQRILEHVVELANPVLARAARVKLMQIKASKKAAVFRQPDLFRRILCLLENHHYTLRDRGLVVGLFDKTLLRSVIIGEHVTDVNLGGNGDGDGNSEEEDEHDGVFGSALPAPNSTRRVNAIPKTDRAHEEDGSSGDEQRTERQRSISEPAEMARGARKRSVPGEARC